MRRPVLFGEQGWEERAYEVDGFHAEDGGPTVALG